MTTCRMTVFCGRNNKTSVEVDVKRLGAGAGEIICLECDGDGDWTKYLPEFPYPGYTEQCVSCKGTGKMLVSI